MSAVTFPAKSYTASRPVALAADASPARGFFGRLMDNLIAARSAQAEREVARYLANHPQHELPR